MLVCANSSSFSFIVCPRSWEADLGRFELSAQPQQVCLLSFLRVASNVSISLDSHSCSSCSCMRKAFHLAASLNTQNPLIAASLRMSFPVGSGNFQKANDAHQHHFLFCQRLTVILWGPLCAVESCSCQSHNVSPTKWILSLTWSHFSSTQKMSTLVPSQNKKVELVQLWATPLMPLVAINSKKLTNITHLQKQITQANKHSCSMQLIGLVLQMRQSTFQQQGKLTITQFWSKATVTWQWWILQQDSSKWSKSFRRPPMQ